MTMNGTHLGPKGPSYKIPIKKCNVYFFSSTACDLFNNFRSNYIYKVIFFNFFLFFTILVIETLDIFYQKHITQHFQQGRALP